MKRNWERRQRVSYGPFLDKILYVGIYQQECLLWAFDDQLQAGKRIARNCAEMHARHWKESPDKIIVARTIKFEK